MAARDVAEVRDHDPDREAVRERDGDDVLAADDAGAAADEDQRERADELGDAAAEDVLVHRGGIVRAPSDGTGVGYPRRRGRDAQAAGFEVECPHCHKPFSAELIEGSAARYRGFKCPHCRLFVPRRARRALEPLARDPDAAA